jgi:hypothetical protein
MRKTNIDDLKNMRAEAMSRGYGSKAWIDCATKLMDTFPEFYQIAKNMNAEYFRMRNQIETSKEIIGRGIEIMDSEQVGKWTGVRSYLEQSTADYSDKPKEQSC